MAGKNTSKKEHESRVGHIVAEYVLPQSIKENLSDALGEKIGSDKQYILENLISCFKDINRLPDSATLQDIKRTLKAMAKLNDKQALAAYQNCDIHTQAFIDREVYLLEKEQINPSLSNAITNALSNVEQLNSSGGRPSGQLETFINEFLSLWKAWSKKPITSSFDEFLLKPSPTLAWCHILLTQVIGYEYDFRKIKRIISQNR